MYLGPDYVEFCKKIGGIPEKIIITWVPNDDIEYDLDPGTFTKVLFARPAGTVKVILGESFFLTRSANFEKRVELGRPHY